MFGTVLVGWDASESAGDAVALGELLAEPASSELVLARVLPWKPSGDSSQEEERALRELEDAARAVSGRPEVVPGDDVASGLEDLAVELGADLIVVGSSRRGRPHAALAGPVALRLLHGSPCPVAVAPARYQHRYAANIRTIAVGYNGSPESATALRAAGELAGRLGGRLRVVVVEAAGFEDGRAERRLTEALSALPAGLERSGAVVPGEPSPVLLEEASRDIDLLMVGSRANGPVRRALLGSVSSALVRAAPCPVLILPRGFPSSTAGLRAAAAT